MIAPRKHTHPDRLAWTPVPDTRVGRRRLLVLHGIYGRGRNWSTIARTVHQARPDWGSVLVDLRLHGDSPAFEPPHTVGAAAADVAALEDAAGLHATAVLGHSFGGKVALAHAASGREHLSQVWVIDSTPETRAPSGSAWRLLDAVRGLPPHFGSRAEASAAIERHGYGRDVAMWMASNLALRDGRYHWRLDFAAMEALLRDFFRLDLWSVVESPPADVGLHFVKGEASHVLSEEACARIEQAGRRHGQAYLHRIAGGHWLNTENPTALIDLLTRFLPY